MEWAALGGSEFLVTRSVWVASLQGPLDGNVLVGILLSIGKNWKWWIFKYLLIGESMILWHRISNKSQMRARWRQGYIFSTVHRTYNQCGWKHESVGLDDFWYPLSTKMEVDEFNCISQASPCTGHDFWIYYEKLTHAIVETEKYHYLPSTSWKLSGWCDSVGEQGLPVV